MGLLSRARSIKRSETESPKVDNYEDFINRIAVALESLQWQSSQASRRLAFLEAQRSHELGTLDIWTKRKNKLQAMLDAYSGGPEGYRKLADLSETVNKLHAASLHRSTDMQTVCNSLSEQLTAASASLASLNAARQQLENERRVSMARDSIAQAASEHRVPTAGAITGISSEGIRDIKRLVAQAEALVELKRW